MGYLDSAGLSHFWGKVQAALAGKQNAITAGDGLSKEGDTLSVTTPVRSIATQAEYDALSEEEKRNGNLYMIPGPAPDSFGSPVPTGAVISFLALSAPHGYLVCDGAQHNISDYPELAAFFQTQFGTKNHFGGDGEATFAVPDLRNLFLRGYRGEAEEQLSGEIGERQDGTNIPYMFTGVSQVSVTPDISIPPSNEDYVSDSTARRITNVDRIDSGSTVPKFFKARPINMAVLYCIKI